MIAEKPSMPIGGMLLTSCFIAVHLIGSVSGLSIVRLAVPSLVRANSSAVVLDCDYNVMQWEKNGLVLKWYKDGVHLVYQWIPPMTPQALGVLKDRVELLYQASAEPWSKHRAVYIKNPSPELSGHYSCSVSTFEDEDTKSAHMLVWAAPGHVSLRYWRPSEHLVNISCTTSDVSPQPQLHIFVLHTNDTRSEVRLSGVSSQWHHSNWTASVWGLRPWDEGEENIQLGCDVTLPHIHHKETKLVIYDSDLPVITTTLPPPPSTEAPIYENGKLLKHQNDSHFANGQCRATESSVALVILICLSMVPIMLMSLR